MNLANKLTMSRIMLVPFFIMLLEFHLFWTSVFALIIFIIASVTDLIDGRIARSRNSVTTLGIFLDPLADKLLISSAFICFAVIDYLYVPAWMVIAIIAREFIITGLRALAASKNVIIPADKSGKFKTTFQVIAIIVILLIIVITEGLAKYHIQASQTMDSVFRATPFIATFLVAFFTLYSGFKYIWKHKKLFNE